MCVKESILHGMVICRRKRKVHMASQTDCLIGKWRRMPLCTSWEWFELIGKPFSAWLCVGERVSVHPQVNTHTQVSLHVRHII